MVCSRALGFVLLFLLPLTLGNDIGNLKEIIKKLHEISGIQGNNQYAMAINVPAKYCKGDKLDQNFLSQDDEQKVRNALNGENKMYNGTRLIAAKPKEIAAKKKYKVVHHSEYRLLMNTEDDATSSHMADLLNKDKDGCTVFFTLNSPCVKFCLNSSFPRNIIPGFELFTNHTGPKAFVFRQVWGQDTKDENKVELEKHIKTIDEIIHVYKCSENECVRCVENDNIVNQQCTATSDQNRVTIMAN